MKIVRDKNNPIVTAGVHQWRSTVTFNPGVIQIDDDLFYMYERAAGSLKPFKTSIGLLVSEDGLNFEPFGNAPIFTAEMLGFPDGSIEDARVVKIDNTFYMCYALQPYAFDCWPNGKSVPEYYTEHYPEWVKNNIKPMITRSGIAVSENGRDFRQLCYTTPPEIDDRDNALFPEKINGRFALLRRPLDYVGKKYGTDKPGIWICYSENLADWTDPELIAVVENEVWEGTKIGAAASPFKTEEGWILLYHGVDKKDIYRVGAMLLDLHNPGKVIGRTEIFIMEPHEYYEKTGLIIPNTIFPTANLLLGNTVYIYYGCCDTSISLARIKLQDILKELKQ